MAEGNNTPRSAEKKDEGENGEIHNEGEENMEIELTNGVIGAGGGEAEEPQQEEEREITQTDHLNKSLLTSFLSRLNDPATSSQFPQMADTEPDEDED